MDITEKPSAQRPRVVHGPHRLRSSGIVLAPSLPNADISPAIFAGDFEVAAEYEEIAVELIPLEEIK